MRDPGAEGSTDAVTVVIDGDRIVQIVEPTDAVPAGARTIDASGLYLIPGLWDLHTHLALTGDIYPRLLAAHGVTGARDLGGIVERIAELRARIESGELLGPRIVRAGPTLNGATNGAHHRVVATPEEATTAAAELKAAGMDLLKTHNAVDREVYFALLEAAREQGMKLAGHIPKGVDPIEACRGGQYSVTSHHWMLAHARAIETYRKLGLQGKIGIALSVSPAHPATESEDDEEAARIADGLHNRWFLDPVLKGEYPEDILALYSAHADPGIREGDLELIAANRVDFLGVNYYAPTRVRAAPESAHFGIQYLPNPDAQPAFNGEVYPQGLYDMLMRVDRDYGKPLIHITENGAGFGADDDRLVEGEVHDPLRRDYIRRHLIAAHRAIRDGVNLRRYYLWSCFDNFEWVWGTTRRFGLVHVDFETQERIWKDSAYDYQSLIRDNGFD